MNGMSGMSSKNGMSDISGMSDLSVRRLKKPLSLKEDNEKKPAFEVIEKPLNSERN